MAALSGDQVMQFAANAGFPDPKTAAAYAYIESTWNPDAVSPTGCVGLWQLCPPPANANDPQANANAAFAKFKACNGGSFKCDWDPFDEGSSNPAFQKALSMLGAAPSSKGQSSGDAGLPEATKDFTTKLEAGAMVLLGAVALGIALWIIAGKTEAGARIEGEIKHSAGAALGIFAMIPK